MKTKHLNFNGFIFMKMNLRNNTILIIVKYVVQILRVHLIYAYFVHHSQ